MNGVPDTVLVAPDRFDGALSSVQIADALGAGFVTGGWRVDLCPLADGDPALLASVLNEVDFDRRLRAARAVVTAVGVLDADSLRGRPISEVATRARQSGVPCHAVVGRRHLNAFELRILDLQAVLEARDEVELEAAGARLAALL